MQASNVNGPCFNYDAVVKAALPVFTTPQVSEQLLFCEALPFTLSIPMLTKLPQGCQGTEPCSARGQRLHTIHDEGPAITEIPHGGTSDEFPKVIVSESSNAKAVYAFERYAPKSTILLTVVQPGGSVGYLAMSETLSGNDATGLYPTTTLTRGQAIQKQVQWGIIKSASPLDECILMYYDSTLAKALPLVQLYSWGNTMYLSRGAVTGGSTGTFGVFHGVTPNIKSFPTLNPDLIVYDPTTLMQQPRVLPTFSANQLDNGASNMQWLLKALPLNSLSAHVYSTTYCENKTSAPASCAFISSLVTTPKKGGLSQQDAIIIGASCGGAVIIALVIAIGVSLWKKP